ncbi:uncharacterized protein LOC105284438 isoform X2 [Ooceraea biroi]|uniref:uncharacterized protein LOC105284438 isoform X2 n=1 Tax=Ooceraea biroi TaxID=2015173 RepID=UPI0005BD9497|nr:uncharacterized protein LOC105284438 isoform X2 [Ooceraea biroi]
MVFAGARCLKLHRIMLTIVGLWPYQKTVIWQIQAVFFFGVYCCMLFSQFTPFLTTTCTMECIIKRFTHICITFVFILLYYSFYFNSEAVKQMVEHMHFDWKMFANSDAIKIFEEYLFESYIFALSLCFLYVISAFFVAIVESKSIILDVIAPMNESRPRKLDLDIEFFVNEEQYFFFYLVQELLGLGIGTWSMLTTGTFLTTVTKHLCATYKIVRFCKSLVLSFDIWYFPIVFIGVLSLSGILFRLYNDIMQFDDLYDILAYFGVLVCYLLYMFMTNFLAQSYTDHSVEVLESTYDTLWYVAPLPIQKLFLIMQKSIRSHKIVVGGLFVASIEGFSTLVTSAVSYFTVMHAMRL